MIPPKSIPSVNSSALGTDCFSLPGFCLFTVDVDPLRGSTETAWDRVEILPSGVVEGEVYTPSLVIEAGGVLEGHCHMRADGKPAKAVRPPEGATPRPSGSRRAARN